MADAKEKSFLLTDAEAEANQLLTYLRSAAPAVKMAVVGSIRRQRSWIHDIDILIAGWESADLANVLARYKAVWTIEVVHKENIRGTLLSDLPFEIIIVDAQEYALYLLLTTGPKKFREKVLQSSQTVDLSHCPDEESVFAKLGWPYIPPAWRDQFESYLNLA